MSATTPSPRPWDQFTADPRRPDGAGLRASDQDREVVLSLLAEGYADGRLTHDEYDERADVTTAARTLGELPAMIVDLVPQRPTASPDDLHTRAVKHWASQRRQALTGLLMPSLICWGVWVITGLNGSGAAFDPTFPWPLFVMLGTGANLARVLLNRTDLVAEEQHRLEKKQKALRPREE